MFFLTQLATYNIIGTGVRLLTLLTVIFSVSNIAFSAIETSELQWSLCEPVEAVFQKLNISNAEYKKKSQSYLDTADFGLLKNDMQLRVREEEGSLKSNLKKNFATSDQVLPEMLVDKDTICEFDHYMDIDKVGCKTSNKTNDVKKILSQKQMYYLTKLAPQEVIHSLIFHGPFVYEQWEVVISKNGQVLDFDNLKSRTGKSYYEISIRVPAENRIQQFQMWTDFFHKSHVQICPKRIERTKAVLLGGL